MQTRTWWLATGPCAALALIVSSTLVAPGASVFPAAAAQEKGGFEVWIADQSDTRSRNGTAFGGQLLVYDGADLTGAGAARAQPIVRLDLGAAAAELCEKQTGRLPVRPHMILFNDEQTHAILSFVASGHVVVFDARTRAPLTCLETTLGTTKTRQAHAAYAAPDGSYIVVANQNGKRLERIDTNYRTNAFVHNPQATLDLATCTTPSGAACEAPDLRPINWPICPIIDSTSRHVFITLRGGGLFVVDATATPMRIVGEYDRQTVRGNGCGGIELGGHMYINSGGSPVNVSGANPADHALYGFDVYRFPLAGYGAKNGPNAPAPARLFGKSGAADSHGMAPAGGGRYLWVMDRHNDVAEILEVATGRHVRTVNLNGPLTDNAAPDLTDAAPDGTRLFVALRGPTPLSGDPHNAVGSTPGLGVIEVTGNGGNGQLVAVVPMTNPTQQPKQSPDPHGLRVRLRR